jgi:hypothetical protein
MRRYTRLVTARLGSARLPLARRKHRFVYCCVIVGACFDVTVLAWRKYATVCYGGMIMMCPFMKSIKVMLERGKSLDKFRPSMLQ